MAVEYHCRHCGQKIGRLDQTYVDLQQLGLHSLTNEERQEMISYESDGNIRITSICEHCEEALNRNPHYFEHDYFIH